MTRERDDELRQAAQNEWQFWDASGKTVVEASRRLGGAAPEAWRSYLVALGTEAEKDSAAAVALAHPSLWAYYHEALVARDAAWLLLKETAPDEAQAYELAFLACRRAARVLEAAAPIEAVAFLGWAVC